MLYTVSQIFPEAEVKKINKRAFVRTVFVVCLFGIAFLSVFYFVSARNYYQKHQPTSIFKPPHFLYPIIGGKSSRILGPLGVYEASGRVYAAGNGQITITDREGNYSQSVSLPRGKVKTSSVSARSVVLDHSGRMYISVGPANKILVYDRNGDFLSSFPQQKAPVGKGIINPVGLSYFNNILYVTDVGDQTIKKFTMDGKQIAKFGGPGAGPGEFSYPNGIARASDGKLYVTDSNNSRVQVFGRNGRFLGYLVPPPEHNFSLPRGIAIDKLGRIHVVDTLKGRVLVFSRDHKFLFAYGAGRKPESNLAYPNGIYIDRATGLIFIADRFNNRIAVWAEN